MRCRLSTLVATAIGVALVQPHALASEGNRDSPDDRWWNPQLAALVHEGMRNNSDGDFAAASQVWKKLGEIAPHHPAANAHAVDTLYWLQIFDDDDTSYDDDILREGEEAIRKAEAWVEAHPNNARANMYLGHSLMNLGRLHGVRMRIYKAGVYGDKSFEALERALELDPNLTDAKFSLGLYYYYASLIPEVVQWLSFLWFVPTADAPLGLQYLGEVAEHADLFQFTAAFYLSNIRMYHPNRLDPAYALSTIEKLYEEHPQNSLIHFEVVEALLTADRYEEALRDATLLEAHQGKTRHERGRANMGRIWRARAEVFLGRPKRSLKLLESFGEDGPVVPSWGNRWVHVTRGQAKDTMGQREEALAMYQKVVALDLDPLFARSAQIAAKGIEKPFHPDRQTSAQDGQPKDSL